MWDNDRIPLYSSILDQTLPPIPASCGDSPSPQTFSYILEQTNQAILQAANRSFKVKNLFQPHKLSKPKIDPTVKRLSIQISQLSAQIRKMANSENRQELIQKCSGPSHQYTKAVKKINFKMYSLCDTKANQILSSNPAKFYQSQPTLPSTNSKQEATYFMVKKLPMVSSWP